MVLASTVRAAALRFGDLTAFVDPDGSTVSYRQLDERSDAVAAVLARRGVTEGDRVVLRVPSDSGYVVAYAATAKLGAITAGVNPRLAPPEQEALVALADPRVVLSETGEVASLVDEGAALVASAGAPAALPDDPDRPVAIVFTSGTTGLPKGAVFCERQLEAVAVADTGGAWGAERPTRTGDARVDAVRPHRHHDQAALVPAAWRAARTSSAGGGPRTPCAPSPSSACPTIGGVAPQLTLMLRSPEVARHDWSHVQTIVMGGAASPPALVAAAAPLRRRVLDPLLVDRVGRVRHRHRVRRR